jgi:hypothetical protein
LDPHAAVAVAGADHLVPKERVVCLATAHPAKFPMPVREALQIPDPQPLPKEAGHWSIADRYPREHVHRLPSRQACTKWLREAMLRPQTQVQGGQRMRSQLPLLSLINFISYPGSDSKIEVLEEATLRGMVTRADAFEAAKLAFAAMADKLPDTQILPPMSFDFPDVRSAPVSHYFSSSIVLTNGSMYLSTLAQGRHLLQRGSTRWELDLCRKGSVGLL